jgi:succinate--hydroxymethylglutarate CoA-transferase
MGLMHITGHRDGPPAKVGVAVTDLTTGLYTSNSIMAALIGRGKSGKGQHIDVSLTDCQVATLANIASSCLISGKPDTGRWGTAHPSIVPYKGFKTSDGDILLGGGNDRLFGIICERLGKPEWVTDVRFVKNADRVKNRVELEDLIEKITTTKITQEWLDILEGSGLPYAPINDVKTTLEHEHGTDSGSFSLCCDWDADFEQCWLVAWCRQSNTKAVDQSSWSARPSNFHIRIQASGRRLQLLDSTPTRS